MERYAQRANMLLPCLQGHRPDQEKQADGKQCNRGERHMGMHSGAKEFANDVDKYQQPSELDYIWRSNMMTLYRYHCTIAKAARKVPFPGNPHAPTPRSGSTQTADREMRSKSYVVLFQRGPALMLFHLTPGV
jgi:hypothetical protein